MRCTTMLCSGLMALAGWACTDTSGPVPAANHGNTSQLIVENDHAALPVATAPELARIALDVGYVSLLQVGDHEVGMVEMTTGHSRPVALPLVHRYDATPLEVLLALSLHGGEVPAVVVQDHQRRTSSAPRRLSPAAAILANLNVPGLGTYDCDPYAYWIADWANAFAGVTTYQASQYSHQIQSPITFYPGAPVFYGTGTNRRTYLGACNGTNYHTPTFEVHRRINGVWVQVFSTPVSVYEKYTFYSAVSAGYRGRLVPQWPVLEHAGVAAAWSPSVPRAAP